MWLSASAFFSQYFRVYGPVSFPKKYDKNGDFVRHFLPVLKVPICPSLEQPSHVLPLPLPLLVLLGLQEVLLDEEPVDFWGGLCKGGLRSERADSLVPLIRKFVHLWSCDESSH